MGVSLDSLELLDIRRGDIREPDRSCICENGFDQCFVGVEHCLFLVTPGGASQCFENFEA